MRNPPTQNHYDVLGVERDASPEDVKSAYRLRSHMFHPDKYETYPEPLRSQLKAEAAKEFKKLTVAYDVLRDPRRRAMHDRELAAGYQTDDGRGGRASTTRAPSRTRRATVREASAADAEDETGRGTRRARAARTTPPPEPPRPRERDPLLVVRPERLDFGSLPAGGAKQLPLRISNAGGRSLFGEVTSNRSWLSVNRRSFIGSTIVLFVSVDTSGLQAGEEYNGSLVVTTLNGGDQVVPVSLRVAGRPEPILSGAPPLLDFGLAQAGSVKARTIRLSNCGTGTLIGSIAVKSPWLAVTENRFRGNATSFEVIANTASLLPGEHHGELQIFSNGGHTAIHVAIEVVAPTTGGAIVTPPPAAQMPEPEETAASGARATGEAAPAAASEAARAVPNSPLSPAVQRELLRRIYTIEPETPWEADFLRRIAQLVRAGERLAPGELAKIYELEARQHAAAARGSPARA